MSKKKIMTELTILLALFLFQNQVIFINRINNYFNNLNRTRKKVEAKIVFLMFPDKEARATEKQQSDQHQIAGFSLCERGRKQELSYHVRWETGSFSSNLIS